MICSLAHKTAPNSAWTNSSNGKILIDLKDTDMGRLVAKLGNNLNCSSAQKICLNQLWNYGKILNNPKDTDMSKVVAGL